MEHVEIRLLELMAKNNMRQIKDLHEKSGVSRTVISDLLNGSKRGVQLETIARLCKALECEIGDLILIPKDGQAVS